MVSDQCEFAAVPFAKIGATPAGRLRMFLGMLVVLRLVVRVLPAARGAGRVLAPQDLSASVVRDVGTTLPTGSPAEGRPPVWVPSV